MKTMHETDAMHWGEGDVPFVRSFLLLFMLLVLLKSAVQVHVWLPSYNLPYFYRATPEFLLILLLLGLAARFPGARGLLVVSTVLCCVLFVFSLGEGITQYLYRRSLNPAVDFAFFPEFIRLLFESQRGAAIVLYTSAFCIVLGLIFAGIYTLLRMIVRTFRRGRFPASMLGILLAIFTVAWVVPPRTFVPGDALTLRIVRTMNAKDAGLVRAGRKGEGSEETGAVEETRRHRNVFLFIIESYGYTAFAKDEHFAILGPFFEGVERRLYASGYRMVSSFLRSPVIGGYSWHADSTLLTGIRISSQQQYEELLDSDAPTIVSILNGMNYRTVLCAPGTLKPWPEGERFYGFDHSMYHVDFDYQGPEFSFVPVPDQYAIHLVHNRFVRIMDREPVFIEYMLVSSHAPFNRVPPYVENWELLDDGSIYHELPTLTFKNTWFQGKEYTEGYTAAIMYVFEVITGYLTEFISDDTLIIVTGDHQPKYPVTDRGQPLSVPVHVLCRDPALVRSFVGDGYEEGLVPVKPPPHPGLEQFFPQFMALLPDL